MYKKGTSKIRSIKITPSSPRQPEKFLKNEGIPPKMNNHYLFYLQHSWRNVATILNEKTNYKW